MNEGNHLNRYGYQRKDLSICGNDCSKCSGFGSVCKGCNAIRGKVFWAGYIERETCPTYHCCIHEKQLKHCGQCKELPCRNYFETRDPAIPEKEHFREIEERVYLLKGLS